jgi:hypothetical protein
MMNMMMIVMEMITMMMDVMMRNMSLCLKTIPYRQDMHVV